MTELMKKMHPRNKHNAGYDLGFLSSDDQTPELKAHIVANKFGRESVDFSNPHSVKVLNRSLLKAFYNVLYWGKFILMLLYILHV